MAFTFNAFGLNELDVEEGGTERSSFTVGALVVGNGTDPMSQLVLNDDQIPYGQTGSDPIAVTPTAGTNMTITLVGSSLTFDATNSGGTVTSLTEGSGITLTPSTITTTGSIALTVPVTVSLGGTGLTTVTAKGILYGNGTSALGITTGLTDGQIVIGSTAGNPAAASLTGGTNIAITPGSNSISIGITGQVAVANGGTGASTLTSHGFLFGNGTSAINVTAEPTNGQLPIGSTGNFPVLATLTAGTGISITNGSGSITISATGGFTQVDQTSTSATLAPFTEYVADNAGLVTFTLPASASFGDIYKIRGKGAGGWSVAQNSGQTINFGSSPTTGGTGGSLSSTNRYDCIEIKCVTANTTFIAYNAQGNITVV